MESKLHLINLCHSWVMGRSTPFMKRLFHLEHHFRNSAEKNTKVVFRALRHFA